MATTTDAASSTHRERVERTALDKIAARVATQFPELEAEDIVSLINGRYTVPASKPSETSEN